MRAYARRRPEETVLYGVVQAELESFLADAQARERPVPRFVERELRAFLACGILAHGFVRVRCDTCTREGCFLGTTFESLRRRARLTVGRRQALQCGAVTFVQRFGDALNLNVHFHALVLDGVYTRDESHGPRFHPLPPPDDGEVARVAHRIAGRIVRLLERRGLHPDAESEEADPLTDQQPLLATLYAASVSGRVATGSRAGQPTLRVGIASIPKPCRSWRASAARVSTA